MDDPQQDAAQKQLILEQYKSLVSADYLTRHEAKVPQFLARFFAVIATLAVILFFAALRNP